MLSTTDILILTAHPQMEQSRINLAMMQAAAGIDRVQVRDLYALYPDYMIDVAAEQAALRNASLVVWQHPIHWYHMPPLMKLWVDEVLSFGWAYGPHGEALKGKDLWLVASTGGSDDSYHPQGHNRYHFDAFLPPYEQSAALCGMRFLPPMLLHGAHRLDAAQLESHVQTYSERLKSYPDWPEFDELEACAACIVPAHARPRDETSEAA